MIKAKCPVCRCWAETYKGNSQSSLGRRFRSHAKDGGAPLVNFRLTYCTGSYQLANINA